MDFKTFVSEYEEPLPGIGLVRSTNDPYRNAEYIKQGEKKRDFHCFNTQLKNRCLSYKLYKRYLHRYKYGRKYVYIRFNEDIASVIFEFYKYPEIEISNHLPAPGYYHISTKNKFKWYILVSNIVNILPQDSQPIIHHLSQFKHFDFGQFNTHNCNDFVGTFTKWLDETEEMNYEEFPDDLRHYLFTIMYHLYIDIRL
jgi:hypothetical protein